MTRGRRRPTAAHLVLGLDDLLLGLVLRGELLGVLHHPVHVRVAQRAGPRDLDVLLLARALGTVNGVGMP